ncbi:MAG: 7-cyano-7-deazaguanine synthase QueC [Candidatus Kapabacteria bacterium]|nr:7-cyano-7-deazaguanine synthase QueC [Candidatus Kapabacteria bacterium]
MKLITERPLAVVLLSGGMDSAVCAAIAQDQGFELAALHLNYGQRTESRELTAFNNLCKFYHIKQTLITNIDHLAQIGGSSLTDKNIQVVGTDFKQASIPNSYVPFRNANILAIATSWAEVISASAIFIGAIEQDSSGYPDCRKTFFEAFEKTIELGTKPETKIIIFTPLIDLTKKEVVETGYKLNVPFELTWSCYTDSDAACGECDSCLLRLRGFEAASISDPIIYK